MLVLLLGKDVSAPPIDLNFESELLCIVHNGKNFMVRITTAEDGIEKCYRRDAGKKIGTPVNDPGARVRGLNEEEINLPEDILKELQEIIESQP